MPRNGGLGVGRASHLGRRVGWTTTMMAGGGESKAAYPPKATSHRQRQVDGAQDGGPMSQKELSSVPGTRITENKSRLLSGSHAVHPRACGEHDSQAGSTACKGGSSPRMRGTHFLRSVDSSTKINERFFYRIWHSLGTVMRVAEIRQIRIAKDHRRLSRRGMTRALRRPSQRESGDWWRVLRSRIRLRC